MHLTKRLVLIVAAVGVLGGCKGEVAIFSDSPFSTESPNSANPNSQNTIDPFPDIPCEGAACETPVPLATPGAVRLTHLQWENAVRDLLRLDERPGLSENFLGDTLSVGTFNRLATALEVQPGLWEDYREAAETLAADVTSDGAKLASISPANLPEEENARAEAFVRDFVERAYRRPLTDVEVDRHVALMLSANTIFGTSEFTRQVELLVRAVLQSPHFLYRIETTAPAAGEVLALDAYERAARLSFALWNSAPDATLLAAAEAGELDDADGVRRHAERMLDDPRGVETILDFHGQLFRFAAFAEMEKNAEKFPEFTETTPDALRRELELFISDTIHAQGGSYRDLLRSRQAFVDAELAGLYGVEAPAQPFGPVQLPAEQRNGLLTRLGFLATNATAYDPNPILRVNVRVMRNPALGSKKARRSWVYGPEPAVRPEPDTSGHGRAGGCHGRTRECCGG